MITVVVKEDVRDGEQLAALANGLLSMYQNNGRILNTDSKPSTVEEPAEHLIVAMLDKGDIIETVFARLVLVDGRGVIVLYAHRSHGEQSANRMRNGYKPMRRPCSKRWWVGKESPHLQR